jgi:transposase-like protein
MNLNLVPSGNNFVLNFFKNVISNIYKISPKCWECGNTGAIEYHHVIPRSRGGKRTVPLCGKCHGLVHNVKRPTNLSSLIKEGLEKAKTEGKKLGRKNGKMDVTVLLKKHEDIVELLSRGISIRKIAKATGKSRATVERIKKASLQNKNGLE